MEITAHCPLAITLAERLQAHRVELTRRWLSRIADRVALDVNRVFPTDALLDHVPLLIDGVADFVRDPSQSVTADAPTVAKAMELGALRYRQGFDEYEILKEFEILGGILFAFLAEEVDRLTEPCSRGELMICMHRLFRALTLVEQASVTHFLRLMKQQLKEREEQLRSFNRALTHEFKNQIGAATGAADMLELEGLPEAQRDRMQDVLVRNVRGMRGVLDNLVELTRLEREALADARQSRHVPLVSAVAEVVRQLRDTARAAGVRVRCAGELPTIEVPAAAVELGLTNYLSNAIKYADPAKPERWAEIRAMVRETAIADDASGDGEADAAATPACQLVVAVHDNGLGVPEAQHGRLFERYFRAHEQTVTGVEGTGLGLSLVREAIEAVGGRVWAEFPADGSVFAFALPCRSADGDADSPVTERAD